MKQNFTIRKGALDGVEVFLSVAQHRNFTKAAAQLGVTPSAISQVIRTLEVRIGVPLFHRTTRSVGLTEAGERFLSRAKPAFEELVAAGEAAKGLGLRPAGRLRLAVPSSVMPILLEPLIASFCCAYPEVEVEIATGANLTDIVAEGFDAGVRLGDFIAADMITVRLSPSLPLAVVGSPEYLRRHGSPERIDDLSRHACLRLRRSNGSIAPWSFSHKNKPVEAVFPGPLIANDFPTLLGAAIQGLGLAQMPEPIAAAAIRDGKLKRVLAPLARAIPGVFLFYPNRQMLPKLRAFIDHIKSRPARQK